MTEREYPLRHRVAVTDYRTAAKYEGAFTEIEGVYKIEAIEKDRADIVHINKTESTLPKLQVYLLRSEPLIISEEEAKKIFRLDKNMRPFLMIGDKNNLLRESFLHFGKEVLADERFMLPVNRLSVIGQIANIEVILQQEFDPLARKCISTFCAESGII